MRLQVSCFFSTVALAVVAIFAGPTVQAQDTAPATTGNGTYIAIDPLAGVRYDNRFDLSLTMAYARVVAGPTLNQGSNLGGLDLDGSYWFSKHWAVEGSGRGYLGTSGAGLGDNVSTQLIKGPFVAQYIFAGGPEWLGPHNKHGALIAHVLVGGAYGDFDKDLRGLPPSSVDFYPNQVAPAAVFGGHMDLNRSAHWVFRITPDAIFTRYNAPYSTSTSSAGGRDNWNFAISVGVQYKFKKKR
ncbi:MAG: hypothetical protein ABSG51_09310 [Terracidiphilus sp.]